MWAQAYCNTDWISGSLALLFFKLTIKEQIYIIWFWIAYQKEIVLVLIISILDLDQKYEMEKRAAGTNLILKFNLSALRDLVSLSIGKLKN